MRSVCDTQVSLEEDSRRLGAPPESQHDAPYRRRYTQARCDCEKSSSQESESKALTVGIAASPRFGFRLTWQSFTHKDSCPLHRSRLSNRTTSFNYSGKLLSLAIKASLCINRGAGGYSIQQKLETARSVSILSPVFRALDLWSQDEIIDAKSVTELGALLRYNINRFESMFRDGIASPYDVDDRRGETILHVCIQEVNLGSPSTNKDVAVYR